MPPQRRKGCPGDDRRDGERAERVRQDAECAVSKARAQHQLNQHNAETPRRQPPQRKAAGFRFDLVAGEPATRSEDGDGDDCAEEALRNERVRHGDQRLVGWKQDANAADHSLCNDARKDEQCKAPDPFSVIAEPGPTADRAGMTAFRGILSSQPARRLSFIVRRGRATEA